MKSIACLLLAASAVHGLRLSAEEKVDLEAKLHGSLEDGEIDDELLRFATTQKIVDELNEQHTGAVFSTDNQFALMTEDEFAAFVKGSFQHEAPKRQLRGDNVQLALTPAQQEATGVDWTTNKCMSPVRSQGSCGSCWSFAAVGAVEAAHCLVTGSLVDFSEQQLVSCASSCQNCQKTKVSVGKSVDIQGESALQSALDKQPVTVVVEASNNVWRNYKSGVVQSCPGAQSDHAVIAVGYGTKDGQQHFKIKNSWGTGWGEQGYMYLKRGGGGKGMCNVAELPSYPSMTALPSCGVCRQLASFYSFTCAIIDNVLSCIPRAYL
uniref:Peptidase C1A papain C-terminal domain-containing protein n=1 Tax=Hucho hucho TaxID=62062 RepID=A0A4W5LVT1_9TELE